MSLRITNLCKTYRGNIQALKDVNLEIDNGMFGLLGPNGAGKTTLMKILATLQPATSGNILFNDISVSKQPDKIRKILGYLPQDIHFYPQLTVWETLDYLSELSQVKQNRAHKISGLLEQVNLLDKKNLKVKQLSGGMKRRLGIAQALLNDPALLIIDEPTAGLDPEERVRFRNYLTSLSGDRVVLLSTHIIEDIDTTCEHLAVLDKGETNFVGKPEDLIRQAEGKVWSIVAQQDELTQINQWYHVVRSVRVSEGWRIRLIADTAHMPNATPLSPSLEDGYMFLMKENLEQAS